MNIGVVIVSFLAVNLDFFFMLLFLLNKYKFNEVLWGYFSAVIFILLISYSIGFALTRLFPEWSLGILGFVPIWMAIHDEDEEYVSNGRKGLLGVVITYLSTCLGCNLAIFLPILTGKNITDLFETLFIVGGLTLGVTILINAIRRIQTISNIMEKYGDQLMKICYVVIGLYVMFDSGLINHIYQWL